MSPTLAGRTILITRPEPEAAESAAQVTALGGRPLLAPALVIRPPLDPLPLERAASTPEAYDAILLTSANGARAFLAALSRRRVPVTTLPPVHAVGPKTARALQEGGITPVTPDSPLDGAALAEALLARQPRARRFLFPQAQEGREELVERLTAAGCGVERVVAYRAAPLEEVPSEVLAELRKGGVDGVTFFSGRSAQAFAAALPREPERSTPGAWLAKTVVAVLSPITAAAVAELGIPVTLTAHRPTSESLLAALADHWNTGTGER